MMREIKNVVRISTHSNSGFKHDKPIRVVSMCGCVHHNVSDEPIGTKIECTQCGDIPAILNKIREFINSDNYSHVTVRSSAMNGDRSWEGFYFYGMDNGPTLCLLAFKAPSCVEVETFLQKNGKTVECGPSRGNRRS